MAYRNVVIGRPLCEPWKLVAVDERDWDENEKEYTLFTETRFLPAVLKEAGLVQSTREVRRNRPDLCVTFADDQCDCLDIKLGKKRLWVVVGAGSLEVHKKMMDKITMMHLTRTATDIFEEMSDAEKGLVYAMVGQSLASGKVDFDVLGDVARSIYRGFTEEQLAVVNAILAETVK